MLVIALAVTPFSSGHAGPPAEPAATPNEGADEARPKRKLSAKQLHFDSAVRFTFYHQRGTGYQSQDQWSADQPGEPGRSDIEVYQPALSFGVAGKRFRQDFTATLDVVTGASVDAIDVTSSASRVNEAGDFRFTTTVNASDNDVVKIRYGFHMEEEWASGGGGLEYQRELWHDNITIGASINGNFDSFGAYRIDGSEGGDGTRTTVNGNLSYSQVLTPTTVGTLSYGLTYQRGLLGTPWNSVPVLDDPGPGQERLDTRVTGRIAEQLPETRLRHALAGTLAQHFPATRTSLHAGYRYYFDDFALQGHTGSVTLYQWAHRRFYIGGRYRLHWQSGAEFFSQGVRHGEYQPGAPITADNDLAPFLAHEGSLMLTFFIRPPRSGSGPPQQIQVGYTFYARSNDLLVHIPTIGYLGRF